MKAIIDEVPHVTGLTGLTGLTRPKPGREASGFHRKKRQVRGAAHACKRASRIDVVCC